MPWEWGSTHDSRDRRGRLKEKSSVFLSADGVCGWEVRKMGYSHWNFMVGLKDYRSRIIPVAGSEVSYLLLGAAGITEFPKNSHFTLFKRGKCNLGSHSLCGTDGLKIHGTQEGRKTLCCSQLLVTNSMVWIRKNTKIPFFHGKDSRS